MGKLWEIVREHIDASLYPPSERQVAKKLGISPTALANWRSPKSLPGAGNLRSLAEVTGVPYVRVLWAALDDAGYLDPALAAVPPASADAHLNLEDSIPDRDEFDLAAYAAPSGGTELEQWDRSRAFDGEEDQDTSGDEPA